ncbi:ABC transporter permease [Pararhodobacter zhoushanensis]|uniref:Transport permease protein n=1 Tax=Pararhodobacter zhoushanensis TaxID=2479545 RepID=A0ABT3GVF2_9RHOB|nr:ABC transporter permease [Pararhodobacter zhoushanensis]MCW1931508.1 ABC transporter permease [Pararhodobacter zhoushanensis]
MASDISGPRLPTGRIPDVALSRNFRSVRTITALVLREMTTRFGRTPGGFAWAIMQPLATIIILGMAFSLIARSPSLGTSFIFFKATGIMPFTMFRSNSGMIAKSLSYSKALLSYPGVTWMDAVLARLILNTLVTVAVTVLILTGIILYEGLTLIIDWPMAILSMALSALLGFGIGVLNCYLFERVVIWSNIWGIMSAPLMIISGVILLYEDLPSEAQTYMWYNPLIHITGMMREAFYSTYQPNYISVTYVVLFSLIPLVVGLLLLRKHHLYLLNR